MERLHRPHLVHRPEAEHPCSRKNAMHVLNGNIILLKSLSEKCNRTDDSKELVFNGK